MKRRLLAVLGIFAMLLGLLFNPGTGSAQTSASGTVIAWGSNTYGQSSVPDGLTGVTAVAGGGLHNLVLKSDGTVVAWGENLSGQSSVPAGLSGVTAISAGIFHSLALKGDGTVVAWGANSLGQSSVPDGLTGVTAVAGGVGHSLVLKSDGTVVAWGANSHGQSSVPADLSGVTAISAGYYHNLALKGDGTVVAWGLNAYGETDVPAGLSGVTAISAGGYHSLALKGDGTVVAWGSNTYGQSSVPDGLTGVTAVSSGGYHNLALKGDGTVVAWGLNEYGQSSVPAGLSGVTAIASGGYHNLALISSTAPELAITQTADHATVSTGDPVGFTITVTNNGDGTASGVMLTDPLPTAADLSWSVGGTDAASCTITAGVVSCNFGDMPPGAVKTVRLTSPTQWYDKYSCRTISSIATVMAYNQPEGRSATASTTVLCPNVYINVWAENPSYPAGSPISFTTEFGNLGDGIARAVLAETELPTNPGLSWSIMNIIPAEAANNCVFGTDPWGTYELICSFDQLPAGQVVTITLTSPTTSDSCGFINSVGYLSLSNGRWSRSIMKPPIVTCTVGATVQPGEAATLTLLNGRGQIEFPADLVTTPTTFTYTEQDAPSQPLGSNTFAGLSFTLDATDSAGNPVTSFPASYTIRLTYQDSDWQSAGIAYESLLNLAYWDTASAQWANVLPCEGCSLDTQQNHLVAILNHLTEFALLAPTDTTPPATSASLSPEASASGWHAGPVTVMLTASDSESGVHNTEYNLNGEGWTTYNAPFVVSSESTSSTEHNNVQYRSTDGAGNVEETQSLTIRIDMTVPTTSASLSPEAGASGWYAGPVMVTLTASDSKSGVHNTEYNLNGAGWTTYSAPFEVSSESASSTVHNTVQYRSTDKSGNVEETKSLTIKIDTTAPTVGASVPQSGSAVQGGIKFGVSLADTLSGPAGATLSIREADGASGKEIGYENLAAVYNSTLGNWELAQPFDTTQVPDGFYVLVATGKDVAGNEKTEIIPFSVRNWAVLELLPSTENNKAGRTMPVKFSLRVVQEVDPAQPFVYSAELTITIYEAGQPTPVLQSSTFGSGARDYRINAAEQTYITNFQTLKKPMQYTVEILRDALSIGTFGFQTTK